MAGNIWEITVLGNIWGFAHENVLHFDNSAGVGNDPALMAAEIQNNWCNILKASFSGDLKLTGIIARQMTVPNPLTHNINWTPIAGALPTNGQANQVAVLFKKRSNFGGRANMGRFYVSGLQSGNLLNGRFTSAAMTNYNNMVAQLVARYCAGGSAPGPMQLVILSRKKLATGVGAAEAVVSCTGITVVDVPATQRRRRFGVGI